MPVTKREEGAVNRFAFQQSQKAFPLFSLHHQQLSGKP